MVLVVVTAVPSRLFRWRAIISSSISSTKNISCINNLSYSPVAALSQQRINITTTLTSPASHLMHSFVFMDATSMGSYCQCAFLSPVELDVWSHLLLCNVAEKPWLLAPTQVFWFQDIMYSSCCLGSELQTKSQLSYSMMQTAMLPSMQTLSSISVWF